MRELRYLELRLEPSYFIKPNGEEIRELRIDMKYNGNEYHRVENLWQSDAISVLDYCFDRAKRCMHEAIKEYEK